MAKKLKKELTKQKSVPEKVKRNSQSGSSESGLEKSKYEIRQMWHMGPLPHPELFRQYNEVLPGAGERILAMAENQSKHRQALEMKAMNTSTRNESISLWLAFILTIVTIAGGIILIWSGKDIGGLAIIIGALAALVTAFVVGKSKNKKEAEKEDNTSNEQAAQ